MPRQRCCGLIEDLPPCRKFLAEGAGGEPVTLRLEEFEAIRLKDSLGLDQHAAAQLMGLTRPTFQRLLQAGRSKVAGALTAGRTMLIEGGSYVIMNRRFECVKCGHAWEEPPCTEGGKHGYEIVCPACGNASKRKVLEDGGRVACGGQAHRHGHGQGQGHGGCCCCGGKS